MAAGGIGAFVDVCGKEEMSDTVMRVQGSSLGMLMACKGKKLLIKNVNGDLWH